MYRKDEGLETEINNLKKELYDMLSKDKVVHIKVIQLSQRIDELIVKYYKNNTDIPKD